MRFIRRIKRDFAYVTNVLISLLLCISCLYIVIVYRARILLLYIVYCMCSYIVFRFLCRFLVYECPLFLALYLSLSFNSFSLFLFCFSFSLWQNTANCRSCQSCPCARRQSPVIICRWTVSVVLPIHVSSAACCMPVRIQRAFCGINMRERSCWNAHALHNFCAP